MLATPLLDLKLILRRKSKQVLEKPQQPSKSQHFSQQNSTYNQYISNSNRKIYRNIWKYFR